MNNTLISRSNPMGMRPSVADLRVLSMGMDSGGTRGIEMASYLETTGAVRVNRMNDANPAIAAAAMCVTTTKQTWTKTPVILFGTHSQRPKEFAL